MKLRVEEGFPIGLLCKEAGISKSAINHWVKAYQDRGEAGLRNPGVFSKKEKKLPGPVREKIVEIKKQKPFFGVQRRDCVMNRVSCIFTEDVLQRVS